MLQITHLDSDKDSKNSLSFAVKITEIAQIFIDPTPIVYLQPDAMQYVQVYYLDNKARLFPDDIDVSLKIQTTCPNFISYI